MEKEKQRRVFIGWGEGIAASGAIGRRNMDMPVEVFDSLVSEARRSNCTRLTAVSTNALRISADGKEVRARLEEKAGLSIDVLSSRGEAFLGFAGACSLLKPGTPVILADPGGTSTELSWGRAPSAEDCAGIPVGTHIASAMMRRGAYIAPETPPATVSRAVSSMIAGMIRGASVPAGDSPLPGSNENPTIMLTGGTAVSIAVVWRYMKRDGVRASGLTEMTLGQMQLLGRRLSALSNSGRVGRVPLPPERVALLLPGYALVSGVVTALEAEKMYISTRDLRWGVLLGEERIERGYLANEQESPDS